MTEEVTDAMAKVVFDAMVWTVEQPLAGRPPTWFPGGNSFAQDRARQAVRELVAMRSASNSATGKAAFIAGYNEGYNEGYEDGVIPTFHAATDVASAWTRYAMCQRCGVDAELAGGG